jgi:hypothetical protein
MRINEFTFKNIKINKHKKTKVNAKLSLQAYTHQILTRKKLLVLP